MLRGRNKFLFLVLILLFAVSFFAVFPISLSNDRQYNTTAQTETKKTVEKTPLLPLAQSKLLNNDYHIFQTFNNCGPASLSMALSYFGINKNQKELGNELRPYQNPQGDNDDKSVTLEEIADKATEYGLLPYHRPNGNMEILEQFINNDMPVIARTLLKEDDDIGHYRVVKGFNLNKKEIIQDDSMQGKNVRYSYSEFNSIWKQFNYEYLVLVPQDKKNTAEEILGKNLDEKYAWQKAVELSQKQLSENPNDTYAQFNLSVAFYNIGDFKKSTEEFEKVENILSFRTLWYQIEPIQAYFELGDYNRVFQITDRILNNQNLAFSELYILRGKIYQKQGQIENAKSEFEKAVFYNENLKEAQTLLKEVS